MGCFQSPGGCVFSWEGELALSGAPGPGRGPLMSLAKSRLASVCPPPEEDVFLAAVGMVLSHRQEQTPHPRQWSAEGTLCITGRTPAACSLP